MSSSHSSPGIPARRTAGDDVVVKRWPRAGQERSRAMLQRRFLRPVLRAVGGAQYLDNAIQCQRSHLSAISVLGLANASEESLLDPSNILRSFPRKRESRAQTPLSRG